MEFTQNLADRKSSLGYDLSQCDTTACVRNSAKIRVLFSLLYSGHWLVAYKLCKTPILFSSHENCENHKSYDWSLLICTFLVKAEVLRNLWILCLKGWINLSVYDIERSITL